MGAPPFLAKGVMSPLTHPRRLYGTLATAEMVTWTLLLAGMAGKYLLRLGGLGELGVRVGGSVHGFVFLAYCLVTVLVAVDQRWRAGHLLVGLAAAVVPYATVPFERWADRRGLLEESWRLRREPADGFVQKLVAASLRRPLPAAAAALVLVALVFAGLLAAGPPTQWFS
ncbi:DUF3817 domain-containing protein [Piscicoccus intestinalis]|uniref:DUF3817 domain-containing protein n=1 Tax=Piscicoccus intestinalis TaxID=746033 RepID=UPI000AA71195|nr:DUF3817 domain-containing protein [Piscicoccus intestinalis]